MITKQGDKMLRPSICGGIGGIIPIIAVLIVSDGEPLASYIANLAIPAVGAKLIGFVIKASGLFFFGIIWVIVNKETNLLRAFQMGVAAPAVITGMIATSEANQNKKPPQERAAATTTTNSSRQDFEFALIGSAYASSASEKVEIQQLAFFSDVWRGVLNDSIVDDLPIEKLPDQFSGSDRKLASDRLVHLYTASEQNRELIVSTLINSVKPDVNGSYLINFYVARTLSQISGGWEGTSEQRQAIEQLRTHSNYSDADFKGFVDRAIANWKQRQRPS